MTLIKSFRELNVYNLARQEAKRIFLRSAAQSKAR